MCIHKLRPLKTTSSACQELKIPTGMMRLWEIIYFNVLDLHVDEDPLGTVGLDTVRRCQAQATQDNQFCLPRIENF